MIPHLTRGHGKHHALGTKGGLPVKGNAPSCIGLKAEGCQPMGISQQLLGTKGGLSENGNPPPPHPDGILPPDFPVIIKYSVASFTTSKCRWEGGDLCLGSISRQGYN